MPPKQPNADPIAQAEALRERLGMQNTPVLVERIAKLQGAKVLFSPFDKEISGMIHIKDGVPIIGVNSLHHPNRQRFTIGHELGHLELHREMITSNVHVDKEFPGLMRDVRASLGTEEIEIAANKFSSALLIPRHVVEELLAGKQFDIDNDAPIDELARKLRVSRQALEYRIRNFR